MRRMGIGILIILAVAAGVSGVANYAYHLGLARGIASAAAPSAPGAAPVYPYGAYPGYPYAGPFGFGFAGLALADFAARPRGGARASIDARGRGVRAARRCAAVARRLAPAGA